MRCMRVTVCPYTAHFSWGQFSALPSVACGQNVMLKLCPGISVALEQVHAFKPKCHSRTDSSIQTGSNPGAHPDLFIQQHFPCFICAVKGELFLLFHQDFDIAFQALPKGMSKCCLLIVYLFENHYFVSPLHSWLDFL